MSVTGRNRYITSKWHSLAFRTKTSLSLTNKSAFQSHNINPLFNNDFNPFKMYKTKYQIKIDKRPTIIEPLSFSISHHLP